MAPEKRVSPRSAANIVAAVVDEPLEGGGITAVSRVDGTIRRSTGWWSDAVHALLGYLEASKFDAAPRYLGTDGLGRETLSEVPGRPCLGPELDRDELLASAASLIRRYHDLVAGWTYPPNGWQRAPGPERGGDVVCHNDLAPWNFLHKWGKITGLVDWDVAAPGTRAWDLAYFAYSWVPLAAPENRAPMGRPADPAIPHRMTLVRDSYGCSASLWADVISAIPDRVEAAYLTAKTWAAEGRPGWAKQWEQPPPWRHGSGFLRDLQWLRTDPAWRLTGT
jgi:Phosphotransferase enzyme family